MQVGDRGSELDVHRAVAVEGGGGGLEGGERGEWVWGCGCGARTIGGGEEGDVVVRVGGKCEARVREVGKKGAGGGGSTAGETNAGGPDGVTRGMGWRCCVLQGVVRVEAEYLSGVYVLRCTEVEGKAKGVLKSSVWPKVY